MQQPHPPVWLASSSPDAIDWSAAHGYSILMDPHSTHADLGTKYQDYLGALADHGHSADGRVTPMARLVAVAATDDEAREVARRGAEWTIASYINPARTSFTPDLRPASARSAPAPTVDPVTRYVDQVIIHGSPSRVVDELHRLQDEIGLHYLLCAPLSHESFLRLTEEVIPRV
ncbi:MAG: LLM class flavin-dependent oxidoreductase [Actinobacteria bacterium]|nr:MAG: LLM class flavin-dependent oxidoreductase [Actinomycetota bacterium]